MAAKNKPGANPDLEGQMTIDDADAKAKADAEAKAKADADAKAAADAEVAALAAAAKPEPWTPKKGADCTVFLLRGGPSLQRTKGVIVKVLANGRADIDVRMSDGSKQSMQMGPAIDNQFGAGYDAP